MKHLRVLYARVLYAAFSATTLISSTVMSAELAATPGQLKCEIGPLDKTYGMTQWLVYGCTDDRTAVIVSAPGNPAFPFVFAFVANEKGYRLYGEGTGRKDATEAAFNELKALSEKDIVTLIEQTKTVQRKEVK